MTARLVRLPDQFRPSRDAPIAATPTCCCCCCCCVSTLITSSVVLPMRVELAARGVQTPVESAVVTRSKVIAGLAPSLAMAGAIFGASTTRHVFGFIGGFVLVLAGLLAVAYEPFRKSGAAIPTAGAIAGFFALEFAVGLIGILVTLGVGYLAIAITGGVWCVRIHRRRLGGGAPPGAMPPGAMPPGQPPPPPPLPPSRNQ